MRFFLIFALLLCPSAWAQKKTIFLITDAEGVGGVCRQDQTDPKIRRCASYSPAKSTPRWKAFSPGGADEVIVWDGHDGSQTLSTLTIHPKAKLLMGALGPSMLMERRFVRRRLCRPAQQGEHPRRHHGAQLQFAGNPEHAAERQAGRRDRRDRRHGRPLRHACDHAQRRPGGRQRTARDRSRRRARRGEGRPRHATPASACPPRPRATPSARPRGAAWRRSAPSSLTPSPVPSPCRSSTPPAIRSPWTPNRAPAPRSWTTARSASAARTSSKPGACTARVERVDL